jgi:hypothetical protein
MSEIPESADPLASDRPASDADSSPDRPASSTARLLLVPLVLVFAAVLVWLWVGWPGREAVSPQDLVRDLGRPNRSHWQQAYALAGLLRDPQQARLKHDSALAAELIALLEAQLDAAQLDSNRVNLRVFLCRALGEFAVPSVQPVLMRASRLERDPAEIVVRRSALEALAAHAVCGGAGTREDSGALVEIVIATARESGQESADKAQRAELRASAAFALGVLGGDPALAQLQRMLDDPNPNVRYNAATGLARHGRTEATPVLLEMLDPHNSEAVAGEVSAAGRAWKHTVVLANAVRAAQQLAERNPQADRQPLVTAIEALVNADLTAAVRSQAREALLALSAKPKQ